MPSRALTTVISLDDPVEVGVGGVGDRAGRFTGVVSGLRSRSVEVRHDGSQHGVQISLTPLGARAVYGLPASELADELLPLDAVLGATGDELVTRLRGEQTWAGRFAVLDEVLLGAVGRRSERVLRVKAEVGEAWRRLVASRGRMQVGSLAAEVGWSRRHLGERFRAELGLTPKTLARVLRLEHAHELAVASSAPPWADVAAVAGYADQAHLVREWRDLTGLPPARWRAAEVLPGS
jgi:AraC-like DNA-binding protein